MKTQSLPRLARRPLAALTVLLGILLVNFCLIQATDTGRMRRESLNDKSASPEEIERRIQTFRRQFDLDRAVPVRFALWLGRVVRFDFGDSMTEARSVRSLIGESLALSLWLQIPAILLFYLVGIPLGVFSARRAGSLLDRLIGTAALGLYAVPTFWFASLLLIYGATTAGLDLFPMEGLSRAGAEGAGFMERLTDRFAHLILPVTALAVPGITMMARQTRSAMRETLASDFILAARAGGVPENRVIWVHALRHSLVPAAALFGLLLPQVVAGSVIVEQIFNINGMGQLLLRAAQARDFPVLQAVLLLTCVLTLIGLILSDYLVARLVAQGRAH